MENELVHIDQWHTPNTKKCETIFPDNRNRIYYCYGNIFLTQYCLGETRYKRLSGRLIPE